jgi:prepilin-type processing-associated H-X9-DG protein
VNGALGAGPVFNSGIPGRTYFSAHKTSDLLTPGPALILCVIDEHPDSINDGLFMFNPGLAQGQEKWRDLPGSTHGGAGGMSFCDGHSEIHKWRNERGYTCYSVRYVVWDQTNERNINLGINQDYEWLDERMPYHLQ